MSISNNGIPPLSILDYSFNSLPCESDGTELERHPAMTMDDTCALSDDEMFPFGDGLNTESQIVAHKEKMNVSNKGIPSVSMPDYSFNSLPCELDGTEVDQYQNSLPCQLDGTEVDQYLAIAMVNTFPLPDHEMFSFGEELMSHNLFDIFPFGEELINDNQMSVQLNRLSQEDNSQTVNGVSVPAAHFRNEILPKNGSDQILSSEKILNVDGAESARLCTKDSSYHQALHGEKEKGLELFQLLLASGRMVGDGKYDDTALLVRKCENLSCQLGNPIQRLAYYISSALQERIQRHTLGMLNNVAKPIPEFPLNIDNEFEEKRLCSLLAYYHNALPYIKVMQFTSVQAIIDVVGNARKIHIIDLRMRSGSHWTILMEYLAHRAVSSSFPALELLRITAVGMNKEELMKRGRTLHELARSLAIPFSYGMVDISNIEDSKVGLFTVKSGEALAVYAPVILDRWLYDPVRLYNLLCVIKKLRPRIMVNCEIEAQHNSPSFVNRFREVLSHNMAYFDLLDVTLTDRNDIKRVMHEELINGSQIRNMIVCEGKERTVMHVRTDVWRFFFKQAGFREKNFSLQAMYQARLLLGEYASGEYYTLEHDGYSIIVTWKGTPLIALSAWSGNS